MPTPLQDSFSRFIAHFPHRLHTILTDNGSEFTDRFAVDMKDKPRDRPSGRHPFDRVCAEHNIDHRLTKPYRPQTNGLVERFNRRIVEAIGRQPKRPTAHRLFVSHPERDAFLNRFVNDYNRTRLKCLGYLAPIQVLANPPGLNTIAGADGARPLVPATHLRPRFADQSHECFCLQKNKGRRSAEKAQMTHGARHASDVATRMRFGRPSVSGALAFRRPTAVLDRGAEAPQLSPGRASRDAARRRYLRLGIALKRSTSRAGRNAGGVDARTARERQ